jgi:membrane protein DedA with SNARE-associated domain
MTQEIPDWLPGAFTEWKPLHQGAALALATLLQEDVPTVTAALLAGAGRMSWPAGFFGCFFGIWFGDALLYLVARGFGRKLLNGRWIRRRVTESSIERSQQWFAERGWWLLVGSRFVPGMRLPSYLAAGFLRVPFPRFLAVTGAAVAVWTLGIFGLAEAFGSIAKDWLQHWNGHGLAFLVLVAALLLAVKGAPMLFHRSRHTRVRQIWERARRWEFWPPWLFYLPVGLNYLWLGWKYRGLSLPSVANPGIANGGLIGESKFETLSELFRTSPEFTAEAWLLKEDRMDRRFAMLVEICDREQVGFPLIMKPDVGHRGFGVKLIHDLGEARDYLQHTPAPTVVQRFARGPLEVGVFYYRFPDQAVGHVFAVTEKIFPVVTGDGVRTIEDLIRVDPRARWVADRYLLRFTKRRNQILPKGERLRLVEAGNHAQGCIFQDGRHLITPELEARVDDISRRLSGFFIGRYDLRFESEDDLRSGRAFQILELNGASAEATSIYDARNSLLAAYAVLARQWELVFAIGAANRAKGASPVPLGTLLRCWRDANRLIATYPLAD